MLHFAFFHREERRETKVFGIRHFVVLCIDRFLICLGRVMIFLVAG